jgi:hypothetical protein
MQTVLDAASHIAQEIEKTRQHLANLEQALQGLRPLITMEAPITALSYSEPVGMETVEDASIVPPARKKQTKTRAKAKGRAKRSKVTKSVAEPSGIPATGASLWLKSLGRKKLNLDQLTERALFLLKLDVESKAVIRNRAGAWLNVAVKRGLVSAGVNKDGLKTYQVTKS